MTIAELHERGYFAPIREVATTPMIVAIGGPMGGGDWQKRFCPNHPGEILTPSRTRAANAIVTDLVFGATGCRKTVTKYVGRQGFCNKNKGYHNPPAIQRRASRAT